MTANDIQAQFGIPEVLRFEDTPAGLIRAMISGPQADATLYLQGAHLTAWTPRGQQPVLFTSSRSRFEPGIPIRGGVPIVFPWFGPREGGPMHGFARVMEWSVESAGLRPDGAVELWLAQASLHLRFRVALGETLEMELEVSNPSNAPLRFESAFHTYFAVADIHAVSITGLENTTYIDKTDAAARKHSPDPISIARETDQVHLNTASTCEIHDGAGRRTIHVGKSGSNSTVVWNPWIEKNRSLADMAPEDYLRMLCIETANAMDNAVVLPAGGVHQMGATIRVA